ncbi:MAG: head decoration protein [Hydrogenophaga sp.]|nr:head decoration protein [Hydrogenophaga sp.]
MPAMQEPINLGDLLKYEAPNLYSRDRVTVAAGQTLPLGTVLGQITATGKVKQIDPSATDGSQYSNGVLMQDADAAIADRNDGLMVARHAIVSDHALHWPTGITTAEQQAAIQQLKALGVLVRIGA